MNEAKQPLVSLDIWQKLRDQAVTMSRPEKHLRHLIKEADRLHDFHLCQEDLWFDFSRQRVDGRTMELLYQLAATRGLQEKFQAMTAGAKVNQTEKRAALHTATRDFTRDSLLLDNVDVLAEMRRVLQEIREFSRDVKEGRVVGSTDKPFRHLVVIGIGGSYLGTECLARALRARADRDISLWFLSNVDIHNFGEIVSRIDPETTLWIVVSKSFTTAETMANAKLARNFMIGKGLDAERHFVSITSQGSPGDIAGGEESFPVLRSFHMFDFIGGRYSVTSAVGGVPLSLYLGYELFEELLRGAHAMDEHTRTAPPEKNLPLTAALLGVWNNNFLGYRAQGIIPYASPLSKLTPHIQQLYMESNGKAVDIDGDPVGVETGLLIFGEPGTNAQHSFFQLAHQGSPFPIDFIGVVRPEYEQYKQFSRGVSNHQELWANLISQPRALAEGGENDNPHRRFPGNRPSSTIIIPDLSPYSLGQLLAFYEARTVYEAFIWNINPFDQFGVELGKTLAGGLRQEMAAKNSNADHLFKNIDPISEYYLKMIKF